jgi:ABC-type oligopeptide transport system substrate-binding subunit
MLKRSRFVVALAGLALLASACGGGGDDTDTSSSDSAGTTSEGGSFSIAIGEPHNLFPPQNCYASECSAVVNQLYTGLVEMEGDELQYRVAESVESDDQMHWTITLKDNWKFHNGEPVNADAFIRAWNYAAYGPNAQNTTSFFSNIEGYDAMQGDDPKAKELSGLKKVSDYEFEVTLTQPFSQFPYSLLYTPAFAPVSQKCLDNVKACNEGEMPLGNGPFQMAEKWAHNDHITLEKWADYPGDDAAQADQVTFQIYQQMETAFRDYQAGNLDIVSPVPSQVPQAKQAAGDRVIQTESSSFTYIGLPTYVDYLKDPKIRHGLSLAIDRQTIIDNLLSGLGKPAQSVVSPVVPGGGGDHCDYCEYDPEKAKQLVQEAGGLPDTVTLWVNSGAGNDEWVQAVGNMWRDTFGVDFKIKTLQFPEYLDTGNKHGFTGPYRLGWLMDYPSMYNYLQPIYFTGVPNNYMGYSNEQFEKLVREGSAASSQDEALAKYTEAEEILIEDMPVIPMYYGEAFYIYSENVDNVDYDALNRIDVSKVTVNQ